MGQINMWILNGLNFPKWWKINVSIQRNTVHFKGKISTELALKIYIFCERKRENESRKDKERQRKRNP